jgi:bifunctional non-homologous end joining protein LigD
LRFAADRPVSLVRAPEGIEGERFFQKHLGKGFPEGIGTVDIAQSDGSRHPYMVVRDARGLVAAAQMGAIEFHVWGSRRDRLDQPDRMVFDLDPDEALSFDDVRQAATDMRDALAALEVPSWPLLTGGKGVHLVTPLRRAAGWDTVKLYARLFAELMTARAPDRFTAQMSKAKRKGRIFIDWLRNERGATAIAPFSLRARAGGPVAVPISWRELDDIDGADAFDMAAALGRWTNPAQAITPVSLSARRVRLLEQAFR